jgi:purine-binding chemotaxis protein CheW
MYRTTTATEVVPLIVFTLGGHPHAIETSAVQEVLRMVAIRPVTDAPEWVSGMINLRGVPALIIDLRRRLGIGEPTCGLATPIIVTTTAKGAVVGLIADEVTGLHDVPGDGMFATSDGGLITAVARIDAQLVSVADIDAVVAGAEHLLGT